MTVTERLSSSRALRALTGVTVILALWFLLAAILPQRVFPGPVATAVRMIVLLGDDLAIHLGASLLRLLVSVAAATAIGVPLGLVMGMNRVADAVLGPLSYILYPVPKIALLPVLMLLLGLGNAAKITLVLIIIVFQLLFAARDGVRDIPRSYFLAARSLNMRRSAVYRHLVVPATLPRIFTALRLSVGISFSVIFFAESFATRYGIGYFIVDAWAQVVYLDMFAGILALSILGFLLFRALDLAERAACPWRPDPARR